MRKRLYVSDLDGTLLDPDARLSPRAHDGLGRLLDAGVPFTVATARSARSAGSILRGLPLRLPAVTLYGATLSDLATGRHVRTRSLARDDAHAVLRAARAAGAETWISTYDGRHDRVSNDGVLNDGGRWYAASLVAARDPRRRHVGDLETVLDETVVCMTVIGDEETVRDVAGDVGERLAGRATLHVFENAYSPGWWWINVHTSGAGKAQGVRDLVAEADLADHEIVGFGDTESDIALFEASHVRIAVANAAEPLRRAATEVIGPHTDDAVVAWMLRDAGLES